MKFEYEALDGDGRMIRGMLEAEDFKDVLRKLVEKRLYPMGVTAQTSSGLEIERLKKFRKKLRPSKTKSEKPTPIAPPAVKEKRQVDWAYVVFLILILGVIVAAAVRDDLIRLQQPHPPVESHQRNKR